ncbi:MAG: MBL fold metallo-hydrolase, partial [Pseudomonadota bacterium]
RIVVTHLHGDHIAGAVDGQGRAVFNNAELCVHQADHDHYTSDINRARSPDASRRGFDLARQVMGAYGDRIRTYTDSADFGHGVFCLPLPGHTPGHCGLRLDSGGVSCVLVADIVHCQLLQLSRPEWGTVFDVDRDLAAVTRARLLDQLAAERTLFSGSHFEHRPLGHLVRGLQGYRFEALGG